MKDFVSSLGAITQLGHRRQPGHLQAMRQLARQIQASDEIERRAKEQAAKPTARLYAPAFGVERRQQKRMA